MKTALITGSGRKRIGFAIAKRLAAEGYQVAIHYHQSGDTAAKNVAELEALKAKAKAFKADVTNEADVQKLVGDVADVFGGIDVLVTTSSIWKSVALEDVSAEDVLASFKVNTLGTFLCCKYVGQLMTAQPQGGCIVTFGDSLIKHPYLDYTAYFTAKGSIPTLTRAFAVELASRNARVRVNCIHPGPVMFPPDLPAEKRKDQTDSTLVRLADQPDTVAQTVCFFIDNPMVTGCCLDLDGGRNVGLENWRRSRLD